jgi:Flp pilus assembly protein TadB
MNWIFEHLQLIILVGGSIAYWLNQRRKAKEEQEAMRELESQKTQAPVPAHDEDERVRRIQEEIRRKILERAGGSVMTAPTPPPIPVAPQPIQREQPQPVVDVYKEESAREEAAVAADMAMLERQQMLAAKLRELQEQRRAHDRPSDVFAEKTALAMAASGTAVTGSVLADLRNPTSIRRAIILREVLGTPVGLR